MTHSPRFLQIVDAARARVRETTVEAVRERQSRGEAFTLVDVREDSEWAAGHLPGAVHVGKGVIERDIEAAIPDKDAEIVLHCGGGFRSSLAADSLQRMGYTNVASLDGGWKALQEAGFDTEAG